MLMSTRVLAEMENKFQTGIREVKGSRVADENESYGFIIPLDMEHYGNARDRLIKLIIQYERARKDFHEKELGISNDLKREVSTIDSMIGEVKRLTDLVPEFGDQHEKYKEKRSLAVIGASLTGLAGFLLGNILGNSGGDSEKLNEIEGNLKLLSRNNLEFEDKQIVVNNEFSR